VGTLAAVAHYIPQQERKKTKEMTAIELRKILETLPDDQYIGFSLESLQIAKERIDESLRIDNKCATLLLIGYERCNIGDKEDELFTLNLTID
jgi:hypothetical protein